MIKATAIFLTAVLTCTYSFAQSKNDVIYLPNGPKEVRVAEVGFNVIKYSYPDENAIYSISKHQVTKIEYASGREEIFASPFHPVKGLDDAEKVYITYVPEDVAGLDPKGELFSKATGVTALSSINNVKNRALEKLKSEASMLGANVILVGDIYQRGNQFGGENQAATATQTTYIGTGYSTESLNFEKVKKLISGQRFHHYQTHRLARNAWGPERIIATAYDKERKPVMFEFEKITEEEDGIYVSGFDIRTKAPELKVIRADEEMVILMERNAKVILNYVLLPSTNEIFKRIKETVHL
jgi:hypothetical protein